MIRKLPKHDIYYGETRILRQMGDLDEPVKETPKPQRQLAYALVKPRAVEGYVTLTQLAAERGMQSQLARLYMQRAGITKPAEGWRWKKDSKRLERIRSVLGLRS